MAKKGIRKQRKEERVKEKERQTTNKKQTKHRLVFQTIFIASLTQSWRKGSHWEADPSSYRVQYDLHLAETAEVPAGHVSTSVLNTFRVKVIRGCYMMRTRGAGIKVVLWLWLGFVN